MKHWLLFVAIIWQVYPAAAEPTNALALGPFGIGACHVNNRSAQDNARWVPQMAAIGLRYDRTCHTGWAAVEPEEGQWNWTALDQQMEYLAAQHFEFGGIFNGTTRWNTKDRPGTLPVNNLPGWSRYVAAVVKHAHGKIKNWEVWNEPPNFTGRDQTPADYARIVASAYDAAKAADPHCFVGLAAKSVHVNYLEQVIKAGAKDHFDYLTLHPYEVLSGVANNLGTEPIFLRIVPTVRKMLAAQNPTKVNVPILFTELGCDTRKGAEHQAEALVKAYTLGIAQGVACMYWFEGRDGDSGPMGLLDRTGAPRPAYHAMAAMIKYLGQHPTYLGWLLFNQKDYGFVFQGSQGSVLITWARKTPGRLDLGQPAQIIHPLNGSASRAAACELTTAPIIVLDVPANFLAQARANKDHAVPWGGDFSRAKSVSINFGEQNVERGLHTLAGETVAQAVVAYGGPAREGNVPGGNMFIVDPDFLAYTTAPIEITAVVRRNPANDNAGFKLVYESTTGLKTAGGWYTVPDNKQWHTVRWKITDAQFVNYWGYNFSLASDGNKFNKYFLQSVTVTKLAE